MILAVVAKVMPLSENHLDIVRIGFYPSPCHKKRHFHIMLFQYFHDFLRIVIPPRSIKRQCYLRFLCLHAVYRQFSARCA